MALGKSLNLEPNPSKNAVLGAAQKAKATFTRLLLSEYFVLYLSLVYFLVLLPFIPVLASPRNIGNIFSNMWPLLAIAIGQTVVLIIAGIDLSQTSIMAVTSVVGAMLMTSSVDPVLFSKSPLWGWMLTENGGPLSGSPLAVPVAILAMIVVGSSIGALNGVAVAKFRMPPFMVTLVTQIFFLNFAIFLTKSENIMNLPKAYLEIGQGEIGFIPHSLFVTGILAIVGHIMLSRTLLGRWLYAVGTNLRASLVSGVPTAKVIFFAYVFSGFCASIAAVIYSSRLGAGRPTLGSGGLLLDIIGATVIGGTSLSGGKGKIIWTLFGVLFFVLLGNTLSLLNLSFFTIDIVKGCVILFAALFDVTRNRILARS